MGEWRANKSVNRELIPLRQGDSERFVGIKKKKVHARARARAQARCRKKEENAAGTLAGRPRRERL